MGELNPTRRAKSITTSGPTWFMSQTAGTLRESSSACRRVTRPS